MRPATRVLAPEKRHRLGPHNRKRHDDRLRETLVKDDLSRIPGQPKTRCVGRPQSYDSSKCHTSADWVRLVRYLRARGGVGTTRTPEMGPMLCVRAPVSHGGSAEKGSESIGQLRVGRPRIIVYVAAGRAGLAVKISGAWGPRSHFLHTSASRRLSENPTKTARKHTASVTTFHCQRHTVTLSQYGQSTVRHSHTFTFPHSTLSQHEISTTERL